MLSEELFEFLGKTMSFEYYVQGIVPEKSKIVIFGEEKVGKSCVIQNLALDLVSGLPFLGFEVLKPCRVLLVQCEIQEAAFQKRLYRTLGSGRYDGRVPQDALFLVSDLNPPKLDRAEGREWLFQAVAERKPDVLFLDPLAKLIAGDFTKPLDMTYFLDSLDSIISNFNCTIIITHHARKAYGDRPYLFTQEMTGAKRLADWADAIWGLRGSAMQRNPLELWFELRHAEEEVSPIYIKLNRETFAMERVEKEAFREYLRPAMKFVLEFLESKGEANRSEIIREGGSQFSVRTLDSALHDLKAIGSISEKREGRHTWFTILD